MTSLQPVDILLVEDNPTDAELTIRALKKRRLAENLIWLQNGVEALEFIFCTGQYAERSIDYHPKLILLDLKLPKVNGIEVLSRIKADERTRMTPVVMLTSSDEERDIVESYQSGVNSYLVKPVEFDAFLQVISQAGLYWILNNKTPANPTS
jgi:two-component system, response regulator